MAPTRSNAIKPAKRLGRPPKNQNSRAKRNTKPAAPPQKRTRKSTQRNEARVEKPARTTKRGRPSKAQEQLPNPDDERRDAEDEDEDELAQAEAQALGHRRLVSKDKKIPQETIDTWPEISSAQVDEIMAVLSDAKRDVYNTASGDRKLLIDQELTAQLPRLRQKLSKTRIPPKSNEFQFNTDKLTARNTQLFREVTSLRHSEQQLLGQVKVLERLSARDSRNLEQLKKNARNWKTTWNRREQAGRLHPLLQDLEDEVVENDGPDDIGFRRSRIAENSMPDFQDPDLAPVLTQLRRSLETMQGNHEQVAGLDEAERDAWAALDDVLYRHASAQQYAAL